MLTIHILALFALATPPTTVGAAPAQDKAAQNTNPDNRPDVKKLVDELDAHVKKEGKEDRDAVATIDKLHTEFAKSGPKDRAAIVAALDKCFTARRLEDSKTGVRQSEIFMASATALRDMAPESPKVLMTWINHKDHRKDILLQETLIKSLGKTHDEEGRKYLLKLLTDKTPRVIAATAEALGEYAGTDQKIRKEIFESLMKRMMEAKAAYDAGAASQKPDPISKDLWDTISAPIVTSLKLLSKHDETVPEKWQAWWNKNKKAEWTDEKKS